jgi:phosphoglycolate phosphatase-like HAD superfamily hydrolase
VTRCVIADFDGPIFDGRAARQTAYEQTLAHFADAVGQPDLDLGSVPLYGPQRFIALMYASFGLSRTRLRDICVFYGEKLRQAEDAMRVPDSVRAWLTSMQQAGLEMAIMTSRLTGEATALATQLDISGFFQLILGRDGAARPKPSPDPIFHILEKLSVPPQDAVVIGDSDSDYEAAVAAKVPYYHVGWSTEPNTVATRRPDLVIATPEDFGAILTKWRAPLSLTGDLPGSIPSALKAGNLSWFAGAGVSIPSGLGSWQSHYYSLLHGLGIAWITRYRDIADTLQLACSDPHLASDLFDAFKTSFAGHHRPSGYHFAMIRAVAPRIWTSNYDQLFERAIERSGAEGRRVVKDDAGLLNNFRDSKLVVKVNGDFENATFRQDLDWGVVATQEQFDKADDRRREIWRLFEDDYRNRCLLFVGVSLSDPILRRVVALAASRVPRTRYTHYLLLKRADSPAEHALQLFSSDNLKRYGIETLYFRDFGDIQSFVSKVVIKSRRPIIGVSGDTDLKDASAEFSADDTVLPGGSLNGATLRAISSALGRELAEAGLRVTSGYAPYVGREAVNSAFEVNDALGRFYLRRGGSQIYQRTAPAIIVNAKTYEAMRERFIGEVSMLIAAGGRHGDLARSGVIAEIRLALERRAPVLLIPQAGGDVAAFRPDFMARLPEYYDDAGLYHAVRDANQAIAAIPPGELLNFVRTSLAGQVEKVLMALVEAASDADAANDGAIATW